MPRSLTKIPELDIAILAFFLNFVWEFWQMSWYRGMPESSHFDGVVTCTLATFGDVAIALSAYGAATLFARDRFWPLRSLGLPSGTYISAGLIITVLLEWLATAVFDRWQYADSMVTLPPLGTGLAPLLQWTILPVLGLAVVRRTWSRDV